MNFTRIKQFALSIDPMRALPLALVSLVVVTAVVDILLAFQPAIISPLRDGFLRWVGRGTGLSSWPGLFAASMSVLSIAVAAAVLARFVHGVKIAPYRWLAPFLVSVCTMVMIGLTAELPWAAPTPFFVALSAFLIVGGGEVFLLGSILRMLSGLILIFTPLSLLAIGYLQSKPNAGFSSAEQLFTVVLALESIGTLAISIVGQRVTRDASRTADAAEEQTDYLRLQIIELLERCNAIQARASRAEKQVAQFQAFWADHGQRRERTH
ncbi:MAG: hypothetical protein JXA30_08560 [Deltaproteobacteria bacterium]|nr:hypothetical protein [Deltaproteobacteria bacterium]